MFQRVAALIVHPSLQDQCNLMQDGQMKWIMILMLIVGGGAVQTQVPPPAVLRVVGRDVLQDGSMGVLAQVQAPAALAVPRVADLGALRATFTDATVTAVLRVQLVGLVVLKGTYMDATVTTVALRVQLVGLGVPKGTSMGVIVTRTDTMVRDRAVPGQQVHAARRVLYKWISLWLFWVLWWKSK